MGLLLQYYIVHKFPGVNQTFEYDGNFIPLLLHFCLQLLLILEFPLNNLKTRNVGDALYLLPPTSRNKSDTPKLALPAHEEGNSPGPERKHNEEDDNFTRLDKAATAGDRKGAVVGYRSHYNR